MAVTEDQRGNGDGENRPNPAVREYQLQAGDEVRFKPITPDEFAGYREGGS